MAEIYRLFAAADLDFSEEAALEMYRYETCGEGQLALGVFGAEGRRTNGYAVGKHWMDVTVKMWLQDIRDFLLFEEDLRGHFPDWWLDQVLKPVLPVLRARGRLVNLSA